MPVYELSCPGNRNSVRTINSRKGNKQQKKEENNKPVSFSEEWFIKPWNIIHIPD
jgi:hypothetical protein